METLNINNVTVSISTVFSKRTQKVEYKIFLFRSSSRLGFSSKEEDVVLLEEKMDKVFSESYKIDSRKKLRFTDDGIAYQSRSGSFANMIADEFDVFNLEPSKLEQEKMNELLEKLKNI